MMDKLYSAEDLEFDKYYVRGYGRIYKLLNRPGKTVESYPGVFSNVYKFEIFTIETGTWDYEEIVLNPKFTCFTDFSEFHRKNVEELIEDKSRHLESLKRLLKK